MFLKENFAVGVELGDDIGQVLIAAQKRAARLVGVYIWVNRWNGTCWLWDAPVPNVMWDGERYIWCLGEGIISKRAAYNEVAALMLKEALGLDG